MRSGLTASLAAPDLPRASAPSDAAGPARPRASARSDAVAPALPRASAPSNGAGPALPRASAPSDAATPARPRASAPADAASPALPRASAPSDGAAPARVSRPRVDTARRLAWAAVAVALVAGLVAALSAHGGGWQAAGFGLGPDLALLLGAGAGLAPGQLHPRAVPAYNALHRIWGPLALGAAVVLGVLPAAWLAGALAWGLHVAVDRTCGYRLRTRDGFQRA